MQMRKVLFCGIFDALEFMVRFKVYNCSFCFVWLHNLWSFGGCLFGCNHVWSFLERNAQHFIYFCPTKPSKNLSISLFSTESETLLFSWVTLELVIKLNFLEYLYVLSKRYVPGQMNDCTPSLPPPKHAQRHPPFVCSVSFCFPISEEGFVIAI